MDLVTAPSDQTGELSVIRIRNRIFASNTYLCSFPGSKECLIVDPGLDFESIDTTIVQNHFEPVGILCTHGHFDHLGSAHLLQQKFGCKIYLHENDLKVSKSANFLLMACKLDHRIITPKIDEFVRSEDASIACGPFSIRWLHVPGHTPGSSFIAVSNAVFTGDTLYRNAVGLVDFPGEDKALLKASLLKIWDKIPDSYTVYPGHGGSDQFGKIKNCNSALRSFLGMNILDGSFAPESIHEL